MCSIPCDATILHADLDSFYASVEQRDRPELRGQPVIVGGGVVLAASYEAKAHGVHAPMGLREARRLCPRAVVVPPRFDAYLEASRAVFAVFDDTTPVVEALSVDEAFLQVGGLRRIAGEPVEIAARLRDQVRARVGLAITVGVARTKFLAKVASGVAKPDGLLLVEPAREIEFLHALPVEKLWGVGPVTAAKLRDRGIEKVADLAALPEPAVVAILGRAAGHHVHALAHNRDPRPVEGRRRRRSIGAQRALGWRSRTAEEVDAALVALVDRVTRRLRAAHRVGRTVTIRLRFEDLSRATRSHTLVEPTNSTNAVLTAARALLAASRPLIEAGGLTLIGVSVSNLDDADAVQLSLPFDRRSDPAVDEVVDLIRARFGNASLTRSVNLSTARELDVPLLPD
jgi:DNA polymerase-4